MNEKLNLVELLKDCPKGTKLYSPIFGKISLYEISQTSDYPIRVKITNDNIENFNKYGIYYDVIDAECLLFPSKDLRDWSKWKRPKPKFDPNTLTPFDKVVVKKGEFGNWHTGWYSHKDNIGDCPYICDTNVGYNYCIPYNDKTKHLIGTTEEAPEFYRYWED